MDERNCLVILGPTASGKTSLAVRLASRLAGTILSVDSRQVYRGLNLGAGKDLSEYFDSSGNAIPYRLIDRVDLDCEYSLFDYQSDFYQAFEETLSQKSLPIAVGGTGLYLEAVLEGYEMVPVDPESDLRRELEGLSPEELETRLRASKRSLHNSTDLVSRERTIRAIEIAESTGRPISEGAPRIHPLVLGIEWERADLRKRIGDRLRERLSAGMIEEVEEIHRAGIEWERLERLGLEYRYVAEYLQGKIKSENDLFQKLHAAINQFSKRQMTWFRRMERKGTEIHWIPRGDFGCALERVDSLEWNLDSKNIS